MLVQYQVILVEVKFSIPIRRQYISVNFRCNPEETFLPMLRSPFTMISEWRLEECGFLV